jgi:transcriptional regulator with XRE-family HTH domain
MKDRIYEEERLLLDVQEAIANAIQESGLSRSEIAERIGRNRSFVTQALSSGRNLTLASIAGLLWAAGFRISSRLQPIVVQASLEKPAPHRLETGVNQAQVISIMRGLSNGVARPVRSLTLDQGAEKHAAANTR